MNNERLQEYLSYAEAYKELLDSSLEERNEKDIIYNRKVDKKTGCIKLTYTRKL